MMHYKQYHSHTQRSYPNTKLFRTDLLEHTYFLSFSYPFKSFRSFSLPAFNYYTELKPKMYCSESNLLMSSVW